MSSAPNKIYTVKNCKSNSAPTSNFFTEEALFRYLSYYHNLTRSDILDSKEVYSSDTVNKSVQIIGYQLIESMPVNLFELAQKREQELTERRNKRKKNVKNPEMYEISTWKKFTKVLSALDLKPHPTDRNFNLRDKNTFGRYTTLPQNVYQIGYPKYNMLTKKIIVRLWTTEKIEEILPDIKLAIGYFDLHVEQVYKRPVHSPEYTLVGSLKVPEVHQ